jgi:hypothetical protein
MEVWFLNTCSVVSDLSPHSLFTFYQKGKGRKERRKEVIVVGTCMFL